MPKLMRKIAILVKTEVTYGVDPVPTGAANAFVVHDVDITPLEGEEVERNNIQPYFGQNGVIQATNFSKIKFKVEFSGSGVAGTAPKFAPLLRACATSTTVVAVTSCTFAPVTDVIESVSIYANVDGVNHVMRGCRGEAKISMAAKGKPTIEFEMTGLWQVLTDTALPTATYTGWVKPVAMNKANVTASLHGTTIACAGFDLMLGNQVVKRDLTEVDTVEITDRKSTGSIVFEATTVAAKAWVSLAQQRALGNLSIVYGTTAGNIMTVGATATVELGKPTYSNSDGVQMINMPLRFVPSTVGNDEWSIVCT
jgi:hypothetical protein